MMQSFWKTRSAVLALAIGIAGAGLITAPGAQAVPVLTPGSHSLQPGEERVFFTTFQTGMEITGTTSESHTPVVFLSDQILQASPNDNLIRAAGESPENPGEDITGSITFARSPIDSPSPLTFSDYIFAVEIDGHDTTRNAFVDVIAVGATFRFPVTLRDGSNTWTLTGTNNEEFTAVTFIPEPGTFYDLYVPIGVSGIPVPEPASLALLGSALLGFGVMRRRR